MDSVGAPADEHGRIRVEIYSGPREGLRALFELAEDSSTQLDSYLQLGRVLVAVTAGGEIVGHLQLIETGESAQSEIKNMAVQADHQSRGIGRALVAAATGLLESESCSTVVVATAAAGIANLRFYQRLGFRMRSIEHDAFGAATGYPPGLRIDGIELRDRVWLDRSWRRR